MSVTSHVSPPSTDALVALVPVVCRSPKSSRNVPRRSVSLTPSTNEYMRNASRFGRSAEDSHGRPDVVAERQPWPELVGERHKERGVDTVA